MSSRPTTARRLILELELPDGRVLEVGRLSSREGEFHFVYSDAFRESDFPPLVGLADKERHYRSETLFPFFQTRIPPSTRDDVREVLDEKGIRDDDVFSMLQHLARRSAVSPYRLLAA